MAAHLPSTMVPSAFILSISLLFAAYSSGVILRLRASSNSSAVSRIGELGARPVVIEGGSLVGGALYETAETCRGGADGRGGAAMRAGVGLCACPLPNGASPS